MRFEESKSKQKIKTKEDKQNCPGIHSKFMLFKADADLFTNGTILSTKPFSVKYGPFSQLGKVFTPAWRCRGSGSAVWDVVFRLDHGPSPLDSRLELKTNFLGKLKDFKGNKSRQVFYRGVLPKVDIGISQLSSVVGVIEVLPQATSLQAT